MRYLLAQFKNLSIKSKNILNQPVPANEHFLLNKNSPITRVRIWLPRYAPIYSNQKSITTNVIKASINNKIKITNIGHTSVETKDIYASLWPQSAINTINKFQIYPGIATKQTPITDEEEEKRPPDHLIDLYTLNIEDIKKAMENYITLKCNYHIVGRNRIFNRSQANNCCGLSYDLLVSGGIMNLVSKNNFIREHVIVTPGNLAQLVMEAQLNEQIVLKRNRFFQLHC